jgi:hypothetical protein
MYLYCTQLPHYFHPQSVFDAAAAGGCWYADSQAQQDWSKDGAGQWEVIVGKVGYKHALLGGTADLACPHLVARTMSLS